MKKLNKWLIVIICAVVAVAGVVAAVLLSGGQDTAQAQQTPKGDGKLYWNVERETYKTGKYFHQQVDEGVYRLLFAVDGEQVKLDVRGYELVQEIDTLDVMGLEFDEDGFVTAVYNVEECTGGYAAKSYYVQSVDGNTVVAASNAYFTGYSKTLELTEETGVYDVSDSGPLCGMRSKVKYNDEIIAVEDEDGNITHVFTKPYVYPNSVYWNVDKLYDSVNKISTRQPNALMQYEIEFILNGESVTYICRDPELVNKIDGSRVMGLEFDENGEIIGYETVRVTTNGGRLGATNYYVDDLDYQNGKFAFRKSSVFNPLDSIGSFFPREDMVVYDMTGNNGPKGTVTEIQMNDRVICVLDNRSMISMVYVVSRAADTPMYWNVDRDWNKTTQSTNRRPDSNGWYYFKMAVNGKQITVKTDDLAIANAIESPVNVGLKLNGDVVEQVYSSSAVYPAGVFGSWYTITDISADGTITAQKTSNGVTSTRVGKVAEDCEYYNVSSTAVMEGEKTSFSELKVGDVIHSYKNFDGEITIIYVVTSYSDSPIYWNVDKTQYWDSKNEVSTRERAADGYYHILLAVNGKQVTLRTRDKKIVDDIDGRTCMGLKVSGSTILKVFGATQTVNTKGGLYASSWYVTAINGKTITASNGKETESRTMAYNCQVYDVSSTADMVGEKATVQVGDQIRGLMNSSKQISVLYVLRTANHRNAHACDHCGEDVVWMPWDGSTTMTDGGHYVLNGDATVTKTIDIKEGTTVTLCLNGYTLTRESARVFGDIEGTLNILDCYGTGHVHGQVNNNASVAMISGGTLNIYGGTFTAEEVTEAGKNGGLFTIISGGQINMYDGTVTGGKTTGYGGNINISNGKFTLYGGEVTGGTSGEGQYGGNIALSGENAVMIMQGGEVSGGTSGSYGGNIGVAKTGAQLTISGGTVANGTAATHGGNITVALGSAQITGAQILGGTAANYGSSMSFANDAQVILADATVTGGQVRASNQNGLTLGGKLTVDELHLHNIQLLLSQDKPLTDAQICISMAAPGVFIEQTETDLSAYFLPFNADDIVAYENQQMVLRSNVVHQHCDCGGVIEHTCDEALQWLPLAEDTVMADGGHYYLTGDMSGRLSYADNATVYLCLNGQTLTHVARVFQDIPEGTTVNIYDCGTTGTVHGTTTTNNASVVMVKGKLNIYGGTFTADAITADNKNGGIIMAMGNGEINLFSGTITGGNTTGLGGCVYITQNAVFNMYGGTISGGTSGKDGGTVAIAGNAAFTMTGGVISGGTAAGLGNCVYTASTVAVTVGGTAQIEDIYCVNEAPIVLSQSVALDVTQAAVGITSELGGVIVDGITQEQAACFTNNGKGQLSWANDQLLLDLPHTHCWCIGAEAVPDTHFCEENTVWTAINADDSINLKDGGHYYLNWKGDNKAKAIKVADNVTAYLCLNGSVARAQTLVTLGTDAHLIICDCSEGQVGALESSKSSPIQIGAGQQVTLYSGSISGTNHYNGGAVQNATSVTMTGGSFYMYGGQLTEGYNATGNGGNVSMSGASQFYMYGGTITDGYAAKKGGNVALVNANARFYMYGGKITNGTAGTFGGNVSLNNGGQFVMDGENALIADGSSTSTNASQGGGNIHIHHANGKFTLINGSVTGGTAANNGGSAFVENGLLEVLGGTIGAGTASGLGGTVYVATNGTVTVAENATVADIYDVDTIEE